MATELQRNGTTYYVCDVCGFAYKQRELAEKCQSWCSEKNSCNLEITQHAVPLD